jgi:hypothetical protein
MGEGNHADVVDRDLVHDLLHVDCVGFADVHDILDASIQNDTVEVGMTLGDARYALRWGFATGSRDWALYTYLLAKLETCSKLAMSNAAAEAFPVPAEAKKESRRS